jgi:hypothetical protein
MELVEDEELTFVDLIIASSDMRYIDTGNMLSYWDGDEAALRPLCWELGQRWLETRRLVSKVEKIVRSDGGCFDVAMSCVKPDG